MKIATSPVNVVATDEVVKHDLSIASENVGTIIKALISGIYTNPLRTILIEYIQNALDSHRAVKQHKSIIVSLPTYEKPVYAVEDFGLGMTEEDVRRLLASVCASGKKSDKFVGGFGIGFYAASAYCDSFTFRIRKDGQESEWVAAFGEGSGTLLRLAKKHTTQPNGVRVEIPIRETDIAKFNKFVTDGLFAWTKGVKFFTANGEPVSANPYKQYGQLRIAPERDNQSLVYLTVGGIPVESVSLNNILTTVSQLPETVRNILIDPKILACFKRDWVRMDFVFHYEIPVKEAKLSTNREKIFLTDVQYAEILAYVYNILSSEELRIQNDVLALGGLEETVAYFKKNLPDRWQHFFHYRGSVQRILKTDYCVDTDYFALPIDNTNRICVDWGGRQYPIPYTCKELVIRRRKHSNDPAVEVFPEQERVVVAITYHKHEIAAQLKQFYAKCGAEVISEYTPGMTRAHRILRLYLNSSGEKKPFTELITTSPRCTIVEFIVPQEQELSVKWCHDHIKPLLNLSLPCLYVFSYKRIVKDCTTLDGEKLISILQNLEQNKELTRVFSQYGGFFRIHTGYNYVDEDYINFEHLNSSLFTPSDMQNLLACFPKKIAGAFIPPKKAFALLKNAYKYLQKKIPFAEVVINNCLRRGSKYSMYEANKDVQRLLRTVICQQDPILLKKVLKYLKTKNKGNNED